MSRAEICLSEYIKQRYDIFGGRTRKRFDIAHSCHVNISSRSRRIHSSPLISKPGHPRVDIALQQATFVSFKYHACIKPSFHEECFIFDFGLFTMEVDRLSFIKYAEEITIICNHSLGGYHYSCPDLSPFALL